jgi:proteasome lid subunit RPN8/RPN11
MPKGAPPPAPPPPDQLKALGINQPAPQPKATYADLVEAVRLAYPGRYDDEDPTALAESVLEVYPHLRDAIDPATRGMELLPSHEGGPRTSRDFVRGKGPNEWLPKPPTPTPVGTPEERAATLNNRTPALFSGDTLITSGLRVGGSMAGGLAGTAIAAATLNPLAVPAGLFAGGSAGEAAAQLYEREAGISEEISPWNVIAQGALNTVPVARGAKAGAAGMARLVGANAVRGGAVRRGAAAVVNATRNTQLPARMLSNAFEGAVTSAGGNALELGFEQNRLPTLEESAAASLAGAGFGAAFTGGGALYDKAKVVRAKPVLKAAHDVMDTLDLSRGGTPLPSEAWQAASAPVIEAIQKAKKLDPEGGQAAFQRLLSILDGQHQAGLQTKAAAFLQGFAEKAEAMSDGARLDLAKQLLDRVKADGLNAEGLDEVIRTLAGIDTNARMSQAAGGMKLLPPAPPENILGAGGKDILPVEPRYAEGPGGPPIEVLPEGEVLVGARTDLQGPPPLVADQPQGPRPVVTGRLREAAPLPPEPPPPPVDWRQAEGPEQVAARIEGQRFSRIAQQGTTAEVARGLAGVDRARLAGAEQPLLGGLPPEPALNYNFDPRPPEAPAPRAIPGEQTGVDALYPVRAGTIDRETAMWLRVVLADLKEFGYQEPGKHSKGVAADRAQERYDGGSAFSKNQAAARVGGSKVARTIALIAGGDPEKPGAPALKEQIEKFLNGEQVTPSPRVAAAIKYAALLKQAWDGKKLTSGNLLPKHLRGAGLVNAKLNDVYLPTLPPSVALGLDEADDLLAQFAPEVLATKQRMQAEVAADDGTPAYTPRAGEAPEGVRQFLAELSHDDLKMLHAELLQQGPDAAQHRGWVADALEQRGIARPEQGILTPESLPMLPPEPGPRLFDLEAAASGEVPRGTPDVVEGAGARAEVPAEEPYTPPVSDLPPGHPDAPPDIPPFDIPEGKLRVRQASTGAWEVTVDGELAATVTREANPDAPKPWRMSVVGPDGELVAKSQHATLDEAARRATAAVREVPTGRDGFPSLLSDESGAVGTPAQRAASRARSLKALADSPGARRDFRMSEDTLAQVRKVIAQAGEAEEAGLLVGTPDGQIRRVIRSRNTAADPATTFEIDPRTIAATQKRAAAEGLVVLGSWHSQPTGSAQPSKADLQGGVADLPMLIIGAKEGEIRDVRVWQPQGKSAWTEGSLDIGELTQRPGSNIPTTKKSVLATIRKIPRFTGAMGDDVALGKYLSAHERELSTEPFFHKAQAALAAGNPRKAWLELQIGQVAYGNLTKAAAENLPHQESLAIGKQIAALEATGAQSPAGQLWALYDGRTVWVEGVGRIVATPDLPPALKGKGVTAGPGGILRPPAATEALPDVAARDALTLEVVNDVLSDVKASGVLDDPTKEAGTRLFRQVAEQMLLQPARFKAINALGADLSPEQVAAHFTETVTESARILAALSAWKREHAEGIRRIEGITGASGKVEDLVVRGKGRTVGKLSELYKAETLDALTQGAGNSWDRVILLQTLTPGQISAFDQLGRASRGFMLSQWSTALRNVYSATGRWGSEASDAVLKGLAYTTTGDFGKAKAAYARAGDLLRYAPILRPDGWVMPWKARSSEWETIFTTSGQFLGMGKDRQAVLAALRAVPDKAATFLGGTGFGELRRQGQSASSILNWAASEKVQQTLTMFNRAQEYTIRSAMLHVALNEQLRLRGLDPHTALSLPPDALRARLGEDAYTQVFDRAVGEALNFTFAGDLIHKGYGKDMLNRPLGARNTAIIDVLNKFPLVREGYPFAKFNLSAAPRYLWDHSGIGLLVEPLYAKVSKRGRYHLGTTGKRFRDVLIPEIDQKVAAANSEMGTALLKWQAVKDEITARRRLDAQYKKLSVEQAELPGVQDKIRANRTVLNSLEAKSMEAGDAYLAADTNLKKLQAQKTTLAETVAQAAAADAPEDFATLFARNMTGAAVMLPLAMMIRADQKDQGVPWYKVKVSENHALDLRPFAPFVQYLFVADVLQDFYDNTNWGAVSEDLDLGKYSWDNIGDAFFKGGHYDGQYSADDIAKGLLMMVAAPLQDLVEFPSSVYQFYEGKYTAKSLGKELSTVLFSTSQIAGTTLSVVEALADITTEGLPGSERLSNLATNTVGQMLARFTMPFAQFKGLSALYDEEEAYARIADQGEDFSAAPLGQMFGNLPFIGAAMIPETYNQLTGQPLATQYPAMRSLLGVTMSSWDTISGEITKIGMPGQSVYIRKTGDIYVDKLVGYHYARLIQQYLPQVLENESYKRLDSAALKRDVMGKILPKLKKAAIGYTAQDLGAERIKAAQAGSETRRRQVRVERLQQLLADEGLRDLAPEEPEEPEEPEVPEVEEPDEVESTSTELPPQ